MDADATMKRMRREPVLSLLEPLLFELQCNPGCDTLTGNGTGRLCYAATAAALVRFASFLFLSYQLLSFLISIRLEGLAALLHLLPSITE